MAHSRATSGVGGRRLLGQRGVIRHGTLQREGSGWPVAARRRRMDVAEGLREQRKMAGVVASELGAKEKHRVPRLWPR